jgi:hypothetical protein
VTFLHLDPGAWLNWEALHRFGEDDEYYTRDEGTAWWFGEGGMMPTVRTGVLVANKLNIEYEEHMHTRETKETATHEKTSKVDSDTTFTSESSTFLPLVLGYWVEPTGAVARRRASNTHPCSPMLRWRCTHEEFRAPCQRRDDTGDAAGVDLDTPRAARFTAKEKLSLAKCGACLDGYVAVSNVLACQRNLCTDGAAAACRERGHCHGCTPPFAICVGVASDATTAPGNSSYAWQFAVLAVVLLVVVVAVVYRAKMGKHASNSEHFLAMELRGDI